MTKTKDWSLEVGEVKSFLAMGVAKSQQELNDLITNHIFPFWQEVSRVFRGKYPLAKGINWGDVNISLAPNFEDFWWSGHGNYMKAEFPGLSEVYNWQTNDGEEVWLKVEFYFYARAAYENRNSYPSFTVDFPFQACRNRGRTK